MRGKIMLKALQTINGERVDIHGRPENSFPLIASLWSEYTGFELSDVDTAIMQALLKIVRIKSGTGSADSFCDAIGYLALAADMAGHGQDIDLGEFDSWLATQYTTPSENA